MQLMLWLISRIVPNCVQRAALVGVDLAFGAAEWTLGILPLSVPTRQLLRRVDYAARRLLIRGPLPEPPDAVPKRDSRVSALADLNDVAAASRQLRRVERQRDVLVLILAHIVRDVHDDGEETDSNQPVTPTSDCVPLDPVPCTRRVRWADELDSHPVLDTRAETSSAPISPPTLHMIKNQWLPPPSHVALPAVDCTVARDDTLYAPAPAAALLDVSTHQ